MSFFSDLFSGGGTDVNTYDPYAGQQREFYNDLFNVLGSQVGKGVNVPDYQMYAGYNPLLNQGFGLAGQYGGLANQASQLSQQLFGGINPQIGAQAQQLGLQGLQNVMAPFNPETAGAGLRSGIDQALSQTGEIRRALLEPYAGANAADSGAAIRALQRAGENVSLGLGLDYQNKLFSGEQNTLNRQLSGVGAAQQFAGLPYQQGLGALSLSGDPIAQLLGFGGQQQGIQQGILDESWQKWQMAQPYNNPYLTNFLPYAMQAPGQEVVAEQQGPGLGYYGIGSLLGGLGKGLGYGMAIS